MAENNDESAKPEDPAPTRKRGRGKPFQKGQSGNPGGRPLDAEKTRELARKYTRTAIRTLVKVCRHGDKDAARVAAATALLDRGWGKPAQTVDLNASVKKGGVVIMLPPEEDDESSSEGVGDAADRES